MSDSHIRAVIDGWITGHLTGDDPHAKELALVLQTQLEALHAISPELLDMTYRMLAFQMLQTGVREAGSLESLLDGLDR